MHLKYKIYSKNKKIRTHARAHAQTQSHTHTYSTGTQANQPAPVEYVPAAQRLQSAAPAEAQGYGCRIDQW
jgi:hypothetical protein